MKPAGPHCQVGYRHIWNRFRGYTDIFTVYVCCSYSKFTVVALSYMSRFHIVLTRKPLLKFRCIRRRETPPNVSQHDGRVETRLAVWIESATVCLSLNTFKIIMLFSINSKKTTVTYLYSFKFISAFSRSTLVSRRNEHPELKKFVCYRERWPMNWHLNLTYTGSR